MKKNKLIEYNIDGLEAFITKINGGYEVVSIHVNMNREFCNDSAVSNKAVFKTVKECKAHADMLSGKCLGA